MEKDSGLARVVACDAGPLIHLDELACLSLLNDFAELLVPDAVGYEVEQHRPRVFGNQVPVFTRVVPASAPSVALQAVSKLLPLHLGETQALQIATERDIDLLLTDDTAARLAAKQLRVPVHGTLGILLRAIRRRQRTAREVADLLRSIPEHSTLHVKPSLLSEILAEVEKIGSKQ